jgi:hypothetical protein
VLVRVAVEASGVMPFTGVTVSVGATATAVPFFVNTSAVPVAPVTKAE